MKRLVLLFALTSCASSTTGKVLLGATSAGLATVGVFELRADDPAFHMAGYLTLGVAVLAAVGLVVPTEVAPTPSGSYSGVASIPPTTTTTSTTTPTLRTYDANGIYIGRIEPDASFYDQNGSRTGHVDRETIYGANGLISGRLQGERVYGANGLYVGRIEDGRIYDSNGLATGRIEADGSIYGADGLRTGHVEGGCDERCQQLQGSRILLAP